MRQEIHLSLDDEEIIDIYGLSFIDGIYHIFFLYKTDYADKRWGHFSTKNFLEYKFSSGKADIIGYKTGNTHFFANTNGQSLMMELIKPPGKSRKAFLSLPRKTIVSDEELLKYPPDELHELREYKRDIKLCEGEVADTFGGVFEGIFSFPDKVYSLKIRDDILIKCDNGSFSVEYDTLRQSFEAKDFETVHIFCDTKSLEIFVGGKAVSLPADFNEKGTVTILSGECRAEIYKLKSVTIK